MSQLSASARTSVFLLIASQLLSGTPTVAASPSRNKPRDSDQTLGSAVGRRADEGYTSPLSNGGYMLTIVDGTFPAGLGEPLNVILSGDSDKEVLVRSADDGGYLNYMLSTNLGEECLGQQFGSDQGANLGDGQGNTTQIELLRWNFGDPYLGTCRETFEGGLHHRYWLQNTTGAYFMAVSIEMDAVNQHDIVINGYNLGRDYMVGNITGTQIDSRDVTNQTTLSGSSSYANYTYQTDVRYVSGLLQNSSEGINHYQTVETDRYPAIDGLVAVLTVKLTARPRASASFVTRPHAFFLLAASTLFAGLTALIW